MWLRPINHASNGLDVQVNAKNMYINSQVGTPIMPTGLKSTSSPIQISAQVTESAASTFTESEVQLSLNPLDNEVFVVTQVNLDAGAPDSIPATSTRVRASLSTTSRATIGDISQPNVLAAADRQIICNSGMTPDGGIPFDREDPTFTALSEDYIGIIATDNAFLQLQGDGNGNAKVLNARIYGYRAKASASVYAALVQSEVLSA